MFFFTLINLTFIIGLLSVALTPIAYLRRVSLILSFCILLESIIFGSLALASVQVSWFKTEIINLSYAIILDELSYWFIMLTAILIPLCVINSWNNIKYKLRWFFINLFLVELILINMFLSADLFFFYIWFESVLIPMYLLIGIWGSRQRKTYASFMFFFYTFIGSLFLLFALFLLYSNTGTFDLVSLVNTQFTELRATLIWLFFFLAFAVKVPMFPAHIWLPEAHVEAPTVGSVLLAGVLLKLGVFAILRFLIPIFPGVTAKFAPVVVILALLGIIYISCITVVQTDLKKIIAYASIAHMNYVVLGIFTSNLQSLSGVVFLMISHGLVSAGLFFMIGFIYDRYKTRVIKYYGGLAQVMPVYALLFFIFTLANMSFPGTCNFIGEALILFGIIQTNIFTTAFALIGIIFCAIYSIWLFNRIMFGALPKHLVVFSDISYKEFVTVAPLCFLAIFLGIFPNVILRDLDSLFYPLIVNNLF